MPDLILKPSTEDCAWFLPIEPKNTEGREGHNAIKKGQVFGRLQVMSDRPAKIVNGHKHWECTCVCGNKTVVAGSHLNNGNTQSCGCFGKECAVKSVTTHGKSSSRVYRTWAGMIRRCSAVKCSHYSRYGGRGISVCDRWKDFNNFYSDMGDPPEGMSIDRIDNDLGYSPENCRWATQRTQTQNSSRTKLSWEAVRNIRSSCDSGPSLARLYGVSRRLISLVRQNRIWVAEHKAVGENSGNASGA